MKIKNLLAAVIALSPTAGAEEVSEFKDIKQTSLYYNAVMWAKTNGITSGYTDGTFRLLYQKHNLQKCS